MILVSLPLFRTLNQSLPIEVYSSQVPPKTTPAPEDPDPRG